MDLFNYAVENAAERSVAHLESLNGCYFHGFCDEHDDVVYVIAGKTHLKPGIHDVMVYGQQAKLYYWYADHPQWANRKVRGLVVLPNTAEEKDAMVKYKNKVAVL